MSHLRNALEIAGFLAIMLGLTLIPVGIGRLSLAYALIVAGVELLALGAALVWLFNPELWRRR